LQSIKILLKNRAVDQTKPVRAGVYQRIFHIIKKGKLSKSSSTFIMKVPINKLISIKIQLSFLGLSLQYISIKTFIFIFGITVFTPA